MGHYTHGHYRQISRWLSNDSVEPRYSNEQMAEILRLSVLLGLMAAILCEPVPGLTFGHRGTV